METRFTVDGMTCSHCAASVTEEISEIASVTGVDVDVDTGVVVVSSDGPLDTGAVSDAVAEAGYTLTS